MKVRFSHPYHPQYGKITEVQLTDRFKTNLDYSHYIYQEISPPHYHLSNRPDNHYFVEPIQELEWE